MADSIGDLLIKRDFDEPPEVRIIKDFIRKQFDVDVSVSVHPSRINIEVKSSALAGALRMHLHEIKRLLASDKKLFIVIR